MHILLIVDDDAEAAALASGLEQSSFRVTIASPPDNAVPGDIGGFDAVAFVTRSALDERLGRCRSLREQGYVGAILVLGDDVTEGEALLDAGADDLVTAPLEVPELIARLRVSMRRAAARHHLRWGSLELDRVGRVVHLPGKSITLTARECELLAHLICAGGRVLPRSRLRERVWPSQKDRGTNLVEVHLSRLRDKLGEDSSMIETVRGSGYRLRR